MDHILHHFARITSLTFLGQELQSFHEDLLGMEARTKTVGDTVENQVFAQTTCPIKPKVSPHTHLNPSILPMLPYHMCTYVFRHMDWHHQNPTTLNITISIELLTYIVTPTWKKIGHSALHHGLHHTWCQHLPTPRR